MPTDEALQKANAILDKMAILWSEEADEVRDSIAQAIDDARLETETKFLKEIARADEERRGAPIWCWASVDATRSARTHTWGFAHTREEALKCAQSGGWLHSEGGHYTHVVVEKVTPGDTYGDKDEVWFALPDKGARVEPCEKPAKFEKVVCFTIG